MNCTCNTAQIVRGVDVKFNVQLVYVALIHEHAYEGPCRFGPPEALTKEFAIRYGKPVAGEGMFASTIINAITRARGAEAYAFLDIPDGIRLLRALRARKTLHNTRIFTVVRNNSQQSLGGPDVYLSNDDATRRLGIRFTYLSIHEFLDMMHVDESGNNYTLPDRNACNLTSEDMVEVNRWADQLLSGTDDVTMDRAYVVNSVKAAVLAKKLMAHFGCNAFTAPCPDACATRRMNQEQFTFCLTHSLLNEQGIPSGCELDLVGTSAIAMFTYMSITNWPLNILAVVGLLIGIIFITDYPEQCGAYRDNDRSFTPEIAQAMMRQEMENKKTTVWTLGNTLKCRDFWLITIPMGTLLMCSVGMMTQTQSIISSHPELNFGMVMAGIMVMSCFGSWLLGVLDTKFGTKLAVTISVCLMILAGIFGTFDHTVTIVVSMICLSVFIGAGSNFTVSAAAQYWRREDFLSVFAAVNPIANILQAFGPMMVAGLVAGGNIGTAFGVTAGIGVVSLILISFFRPAHVRETDDNYRRAAGKELDDALVGRK